MNKRWIALSAIAGSTLLLAACGSSGGSTASSNPSSSSGGTQVGVILPDTESSARWENNDRPYLTKAFETANIKADIQNANGSVTKFGTLCDGMINAGVKVIMTTNLDSGSGAACLKKAQAQGIKTIDYDRLTLGGKADYYVSFDNVAVGEAIGTGLVKPPGRRQEDWQRRRTQRLADRQQRHAVQAGLPQGHHGCGLQDPDLAGRA